MFLYRLFSIFAICCLSQVTSFGQNKMLTIDDVTNPALRLKRPEQGQWLGDQDIFVYYDREKKAFQKLDFTQKERVVAEFLTLNVFNNQLRSNQQDTFALLPPITFAKNAEWVFTRGSASFTLDAKSNKIMRQSWRPEGADNSDVSSNGNVAYTKSGNLYIVKAPDTLSWQVSTDGDYQIVYGEAAHRSEFGIVKGTFWSPDGNKLAFYRIDQSNVNDYPHIDYRNKPAKSNLMKYPMAGDKSQMVTVGIADATTKSVIYLKTEAGSEQYLTNITWSPDNKYVYVAVINRDQNIMQLRRYSGESGTFEKTLFEEKSDKYVEPEHGPVFIPGDNGKFLWFSERDNYQHLYQYDTSGTLIKAMTKGDWNVEDLLGFSTDKSKLYLLTSNGNPNGNQCNVLDLKKGTLTSLTGNTGTHQVKFSPSGKYVYDSYSGFNDPGKSQILDTKSGKPSFLILEHQNPLIAYKTGELSVFTIKSTDNTTDLYARLIKPLGFDPSKKYPVLVYVYGGPHAQMIQDAWLGGADMFLHYMASQGYVVFTIDNRGSGGRSLAFEQATFRQLGEVEMQDQLAGVKWLKEQSYVDQDRMACFGWSYGGFLTTSMMLRQPGTFKVGVAGGPVIDWSMYEIMYTERYMDTPQTNPEGYKKSNLNQYVTQLKGKLLIIQGQEDDTVVPQHSATLLNNSVAKGVILDYYPYYNHKHNVLGKDRLHLYKKVEDYISRNL